MKRTLLILAAIPVLATSKMMAPSDVPVNRLIQNVEINLKKDPKNVDLVFVLARLHSLGYAMKGNTAQVYWDKRTAEGADQSGPFHFAPWVPLQVPREATETKLNAKELGHLKQSFLVYGKVLELDPAKNLAKLGRGWISEEAAKYTKQTGDFVPGKKMTRATYSELAARYYREIVASYKAKPATENRWGWDSEEPAYEASQNLLRMFKEGTKAKPGEPAALKKLMAEYEKRPQIMSPIIFQVPSSGGGELIDPKANVGFDIAADGVKRDWPWLTTNAALLAWDPSGTGKITSGKQLFGNRTFDMFFRDGYAAMATLDDNGDGWLTKKELKGIVVWHDLNSNAVSEKGEVRTIESWGVEAIRVKSNGYSSGMLAATEGMRFSSGLVIPTYDWFPESKSTSRK